MTRALQAPDAGPEYEQHRSSRDGGFGAIEASVGGASMPLAVGVACRCVPVRRDRLGREWAVRLVSAPIVSALPLDSGLGPTPSTRYTRLEFWRSAARSDPARVD